jgi:hypothetical protein
MPICSFIKLLKLFRWDDESNGEIYTDRLVVKSDVVDDVDNPLYVVENGREYRLMTLKQRRKLFESEQNSSGKTAVPEIQLPKSNGKIMVPENFSAEQNGTRLVPESKSTRQVVEVEEKPNEREGETKNEECPRTEEFSNGDNPAEQVPNVV